MAELSASAIIDGSAERVWGLLADFGNIQAWWPEDGPLRIDHVELEGQGIGMIRHIYNQGMPQCASERLDLLDPESKTLILSIVGQRPGGITAYVATSRVIAVEPDSCRMEHRATVTTEPGREKSVERFLYQAYALMFRGLNAAVGRQRTGRPASAGA
jgi:hypothetical protein